MSGIPHDISFDPSHLEKMLEPLETAGLITTSRGTAPTLPQGRPFAAGRGGAPKMVESALSMADLQAAFGTNPILEKLLRDLKGRLRSLSESR